MKLGRFKITVSTKKSLVFILLLCISNVSCAKISSIIVAEAWFIRSTKVALERIAMLK